MKGPRVLALTAQETGPMLWRVLQPFTELQRRSYGAWFRDKDDEEMLAEEWPYLVATRLDAIILPRFSWRAENQVDALRWINALHDAALAVIYDVDDDVFSPQIRGRQHDTTESYKSLEELEQDRRARIAAIRLADGVTTSSAELVRVLEQYLRPDTPVFVVPNGMDTRWFARVVRGTQRVSSALTIGWAGGARVAADLEPIAEAWGVIADRYPDVRFAAQGYRSEVLDAAVPADRLIKIPWLSLEEYPRGMRQVDIACCSVADNHFNRCKTPIKAWEFTMAGAACVVSPTLYGPVVTNGVDALIAETASEWVAALSSLIENPSLRRRLHRAQRRRVAEQHSLNQTVLEWPRAWSRILEHYRSKRTFALAG